MPAQLHPGEHVLVRLRPHADPVRSRRRSAFRSRPPPAGRRGSAPRPRAAHLPPIRLRGGAAGNRLGRAHPAEQRGRFPVSRLHLPARGPVGRIPAGTRERHRPEPPRQSPARTTPHQQPGFAPLRRGSARFGPPADDRVERGLPARLPVDGRRVRPRGPAHGRRPPSRPAGKLQTFRKRGRAGHRTRPVHPRCRPGLSCPGGFPRFRVQKRDVRPKCSPLVL